MNQDRINIDISAQPEGIYLIEINSEKKSVTRKLIKK
ncbi:MAG: T9SS type A sorting domain-containing protein [Bacteroidota bacterium]